MFSFFSNFSVTAPEQVLSTPDSFASTAFEFRYVGLVKTHVLQEDQEKAVVMLDLSVQGQPFQLYGTVSPAVLHDLNLTQHLFWVKGTYDKPSNRYLLNDLTISYGWLGPITATFYEATKLVFNHRLAVMAASFSIWFIASAIWTLLRMAVMSAAGDEEAGELMDTGMDAAGELF
jgi:hypothetical protein